VEDAWRARIEGRFGPRVGVWVDTLPDRCAQLAREWRLTLGAPFDHGSTSRVLAVRRADGTPAVLKLSPDPEIVAAEAAALRAWAGAGVTPALLDATDEALLLERIEPGTRVRDQDVAPDAEAIAALVTPLHRPVADGVFPPLAERLRFIFALAARRGLDRGLIEQGLAASLELSAESVTTTLLHGDLHTGNVLLGDGRLVAIDPRPCIGDPAFDLIDWVLAGDPPVQAARIAAATGLDAQRLLRWARATAVLLI
jgi:streptomycin 6-kinase